MKELRVDGAIIAYDVISESKGDLEGQNSGKEANWITLINGYTRGKADFKFMAQKLAAKGYRVLIFDNRGSGETKVFRSFTLQDMAQDVIELWNSEGIGSSSLLGISMGGFIAQEIMEKSAAVSKLILVSSAARKAAVTRKAQWGQTLEAILATLEPYFSNNFWTSNPKIPLGMAKQILERGASEEFQKNALLQDEAMANFDLASVRARNKARVLILHGTDDHIIPVEEARVLKDRFDDVKMTHLLNAGHLLLAESPRRLLELVEEFLGPVQK